ncbi:unnamed protein product [Urochloa decumbens]|uniref:F-box domain-containing protein n=1 Tax=Urochloa decumbens TaxID=240449 RepID=A0ABC8Y2S6_9POAL
MPRRVPKRARFCHRRSWSDLPHDLLGEVIRRLPAFGDRLRLRGVCRQWRRAERAHTEPAAMPWLAAAGHCVGLRDAAVHRVALPGVDARAAAAAAPCRGSFGNWLALVPASPPPCQPFLVNPFTTARIPLPAWTEGTISKIVLSAAPDAEDCTVAAVVCPEFFGNGLRCGSVVVCRLRHGETSRPWWCITETFYLEDIAFFGGNLHAVDGQGQAYIFEDEELEQMRAWPLFHRDPIAPFSVHNKYYLVACHGRLLMVCRSFGKNRVPGDGYHTVGFKVFAVSEQCYGRATPPPPVKVKSLDGHALFVGDACCRAFAVADGDSKIREDQICYADDEGNTMVILTGEFTFTDEGVGCGHPPLRQLQSYDLRTDCFRRYEPRRPTGPWQCVWAQRLLRRVALPPPPATEWGATLLLWEVMSSLGASQGPCYCIYSSDRPSHDPDIHVVNVVVDVYDQRWRFTQTGTSVHEAKHRVAREAVSFLRSRYHRVLDDSQWSSVPHYHSHVDVEEYEDDIEEYCTKALEDQTYITSFPWWRV